MRAIGFCFSLIIIWGFTFFFWHKLFSAGPLVVCDRYLIRNNLSIADSLHNLLGYLTVSWDGMLILTGDIKIDRLCSLII